MSRMGSLRAAHATVCLLRTKATIAVALVSAGSGARAGSGFVPSHACSRGSARTEIPRHTLMCALTSFGLCGGARCLNRGSLSVDAKHTDRTLQSADRALGRNARPSAPMSSADTVVPRHGVCLLIPAVLTKHQKNHRQQCFLHGRNQLDGLRESAGGSAARCSNCARRPGSRLSESPAHGRDFECAGACSCPHENRARAFRGGGPLMRAVANEWPM
jgi:hypothetical protein